MDFLDVSQESGIGKLPSNGIGGLALALKSLAKKNSKALLN
jgi:hypothetical protein